MTIESFFAAAWLVNGSAATEIAAKTTLQFLNMRSPLSDADGMPRVP